jgi:hypothetical protein
MINPDVTAKQFDASWRRLPISFSHKRRFGRGSTSLA